MQLVWEGDPGAHPGGVVQDEQGQVADYIASHLRELAALSRRAGLDTLSFLLVMAVAEAESRGGAIADTDRDQLLKLFSYGR